LFPCGRLSWHDVSLLARFNDLATKNVGVEARGDGGMNKLPRAGPVVELYIRADLWLSDEAAAAAARRYWHAGVKPSVNESNVDAFSYLEDETKCRAFAPPPRIPDPTVTFKP